MKTKLKTILVTVPEDQDMNSIGAVVAAATGRGGCKKFSSLRIMGTAVKGLFSHHETFTKDLSGPDGDPKA